LCPGERGASQGKLARGGGVPGDVPVKGKIWVEGSVSHRGGAAAPSENIRSPCKGASFSFFGALGSSR
jgi:hypothetical protein